MNVRSVIFLFAGCTAGILLLSASSRPEPPGFPAIRPNPERGFELSDWPLPDAARAGKAVYAENCVGCHGTEGRGDGQAARFLDPLPRDFQKGFFKFRSTASGQLPTEEDLLRTVTCGLPGSSMPSFRLLPEPSRRAVVAYVRWLSTFGLARNEVAYLVEAEHVPLEKIRGEMIPSIRAKIEKENIAAARPLPVSEDPGTSPESLVRGRTRYEKECQSCHGATGVGDGPSSATLRDWQDAAIRPRDFTSGVFRAGSTPRDLYVRLRSGLNGTPMPSIPGKDEDIWDLVHYIMSLVRKDGAPSGVHSGCDGGEGR